MGDMKKAIMRHFSFTSFNACYSNEQVHGVIGIFFSIVTMFSLQMIREAVFGGIFDG